MIQFRPDGEICFRKLHKPGRLATPAAVRDAATRHRIFCGFWICISYNTEIFTFLDDKPEINPRTGFDESFGWWKAIEQTISSSLATVLQTEVHISV